MFGFFRQKDEFSCGPIAILNAVRWASRRKRIDKLRILVNAVCQCFTDGTPHTIFNVLLRQIGRITNLYKVVKFSKKNSVNIQAIDSHIHRGGCIVVSSYVDYGCSKDGHYYLVTAISGKRKPRYLAINYEDGRIATWITRKHLLKNLERVDKSVDWPAVWFLSRRVNADN